MNTHDTYECATWLVPVAFGSAPKHLSQLMYEVASNFQHITRFLGLAACLLGWWSKRLLSAGGRIVSFSRDEMFTLVATRLLDLIKCDVENLIVGQVSPKQIQYNCASYRHALPICHCHCVVEVMYNSMK